MKIERIVKHLFTTQAQVRRHFDRSSLTAIESAIKESEAAHAGEIRFVVEDALDGLPLFQGQSARERAIDLFSQLRVWDTQDNTGVLIYLLLADQVVEIVADRGINEKVDSQEWNKICQQMETAFRQSNYESGVVSGVQAVTQHLVQHFPSVGSNGNELPDKPMVL